MSGSADGVAEGTGAEPRQLPRLVARQLWSNLPVLLVLNLLLVLAVLPAWLLFVLGIELPSVFVAGVCLGSVWAATVASTDRMVRGDGMSIAATLRMSRRFAGLGALLGAWAGAVATVSIGTLTLYRANTDQHWLLVPLFVDGTVIVLTGLTACVAFSLATTGGLRGQRLLWSSLLLVARNPWPVAGVVALLVLAGFAVTVVPSIVVLLPAPFAVLLSAIVHQSSAPSRLPADARDEDA